MLDDPFARDLKQRPEGIEAGTIQDQQDVISVSYSHLSEGPHGLLEKTNSLLGSLVFLYTLN